MTADGSRGRPRDEFEIVYTDGRAEVIEAHQVSFRGRAVFLDDGPEVIQFHGDFDGRWTLVLRVMGDDVRSVRNLTQLGLTA